MKKKNCLSYNEAKKFLAKLSISLKTQKDYFNYAKTENFPEELPKNPYNYYKKDFISWGDFLGNKNSIKRNNSKKKPFLSYNDAKEIIRKLKLTTREEYILAIDNNILDDNLFPRTPETHYAKLGVWKGWKEYLSFEFVSIEDAKIFARKHNILTSRQWTSYDLPPRYPKSPHKFYNDWKGWGDFLGTDNLSPLETAKQFLSYKDAKKAILGLNITSSSDYRKLANNRKLPKGVPNNPFSFYKKSNDWKGWGDFLGTDNLCSSDKSKQFLSFEEARDFARSLNLCSISEWYSNKRPNNIPANPSRVYSEKFTSWADWLGYSSDNYKSSGELHVERLLSNNNFKPVAQKRFNWLGQLSLDIYLENLNIAIEIQGGQHFKEVDFFGGVKGFESTIERDERKYRLCQEHKVILLYYVFDDRIQIPQEFLDKHEYIRDDKSLLNKLKDHGQ